MELSDRVCIALAPPAWLRYGDQDWRNLLLSLHRVRRLSKAVATVSRFRLLELRRRRLAKRTIQHWNRVVLVNQRTRQHWARRFLRAYRSRHEARWIAECWASKLDDALLEIQRRSRKRQFDQAKSEALPSCEAHRDRVEFLQRDVDKALKKRNGLSSHARDLIQTFMATHGQQLVGSQWELRKPVPTKDFCFLAQSGDCLLAKLGACLHPHTDHLRPFDTFIDINFRLWILGPDHLCHSLPTPARLSFRCRGILETCDELASLPAKLLRSDRCVALCQIRPYRLLGSIRPLIDTELPDAAIWWIAKGCDGALLYSVLTHKPGFAVPKMFYSAHFGKPTDWNIDDVHKAALAAGEASVLLFMYKVKVVVEAVGPPLALSERVMRHGLSPVIQVLREQQVRNATGQIDASRLVLFLTSRAKGSRITLRDCQRLLALHDHDWDEFCCYLFYLRHLTVEPIAHVLDYL